MVADWGGSPLVAGEPEHTDDDRFWDGQRLYRCTAADVRRRAVRELLAEAAVVVENRMDCLPGSPLPGSKRLLSAAQQARLVEAGFVRFAEADGHVQRWCAEDGTVLALLVGEVTRPHLAWEDGD